MAEAGGIGSSTSIVFSPEAASRPEEDLTTPAYFADLNLDQVVAGVVKGREGFNLEPLLSSPLADEDEIRYRQEVFRDLGDRALLEKLTAFAGRMEQVREGFATLSRLRHRYQKEGYALQVVGLYASAVISLGEDLEGSDLRSRALRRFRVFLRGYLVDRTFRDLLEGAEATRARLGAITYAVRIKGNRVTVRRFEGEPDYGAEVVASFDKFRQGTAKDYRVGFPVRLEMNHIEEMVLERVALLFPEEFAALDDYLGGHGGFLDHRIGQFDRELQLYLGYLSYIAPLEAAGLPFCYPVVARAPKEVDARGTFDLALATKLVAEGAAVVRNDVTLRGPERILVVTGPNQGGKTTLARLFGQLHHLGCLGLPVPGERASLHLFDRLLTHFGRAEEVGELRGKLEDDLLRVREILSVATADSVVVVNEVFGSTSLEDARFLGRRMLERIIELDLLCVCVTFVDELSRLGEATVSMVSTVRPENPAERTFKVLRRPADGLAYAQAIAQKHRVTYEELRRRIRA